MKRVKKLWLIILLLISCCFQCDAKPSPKTVAKEAVKGDKMSRTAFPSYFADTRQSSRVQAKIRSRGEIEWAKPLSLNQPEGRITVFTWEARIVVDGPGEIIAFSTAAERLWVRNKAYGTPIALANNLLYYLDKNYRLSAIDIQNRPELSSAYFPEIVDERFPLSLLVPLPDHFLAVVQAVAGIDGPPPRVFVESVRYGERTATWEFSFEGIQQLRPLYIESLNRVVVFSKEIIVYDAGAGKELRRIKPLSEKLIGCSADTEGRLYLAGVDEGKNYLCTILENGTMEWYWSDPVPTRVWNALQPPVLGDEGDVYLLAGTQVLTINKGKLTRTIERPDEELSFAIAAADGQLLLVSGKKLLCVNREGKELFDLEVPDVIVAPPAVDAVGTVYVVTREKLIKTKQEGAQK